jgi:hypothetical protein
VCVRRATLRSVLFSGGGGTTFRVLHGWDELARVSSSSSRVSSSSSPPSSSGGSGGNAEPPLTVGGGGGGNRGGSSASLFPRADLTFSKGAAPLFSQGAPTGAWAGRSNATAALVGRGDVLASTLAAAAANGGSVVGGGGGFIIGGAGRGDTGLGGGGDNPDTASVIDPLCRLTNGSLTALYRLSRGRRSRGSPAPARSSRPRRPLRCAA